MTKRYRVLFLLMALVVLTSSMLCACTSPKPQSNAEGTEAAATEEAADNTEAPGETEAPEATETAAVPEETQAPVPTEAADGPLSYEVVPFDGSEYRCDMNGDGTDEVVTVTVSQPNEYDLNYTVRIASDDGAAVAVDKEDVLENNYEGYGIMLYSSREGELPVLLVCVWQDSDDPTVFAYRAGSGSGEVTVFDKWASFASPEYESALPVNRGYLTLESRTELMGTSMVYGDYVIGEEGFVLVSDDYEYAANCPAVAVINDLPVTIIDEGSDYEVKLVAGSTVLPISTDGETYVYAQFSSGDTGYVYYDSAEYPYTIKGQPQDHYLDVLYCD